MVRLRGGFYAIVLKLPVKEEDEICSHSVVADEQILLNKDGFGHEHIVKISKGQTLVPDKESLTSDNDPVS